MKLVPGGADAARISLRGDQGDHVGTPCAAARLRSGRSSRETTGTCWEATYSAPTKNEDGGFVAKPD
jgi:hypothetical protein